jgi:hypothetical protein
MMLEELEVYINYSGLCDLLFTSPNCQHFGIASGTSYSINLDTAPLKTAKVMKRTRMKMMKTMEKMMKKESTKTTKAI